MLPEVTFAQKHDQLSLMLMYSSNAIFGNWEQVSQACKAYKKYKQPHKRNESAPRQKRSEPSFKPYAFLLPDGTAVEGTADILEALQTQVMQSFV